MRRECKHCGFVAEWANESCWCGALSNPERKPTHPENMKKEEKIIQLLEMIVKQNEEIIKNQNIWRTLPTVPVPPNIDPHFGKDIPYKPTYNNNILCLHCGKDSGIPNMLHMVVPPEGLKCMQCGRRVVYSNSSTCQVTPIRDENSVTGGAKVNADSLPDREWYG